MPLAVAPDKKIAGNISVVKTIIFDMYGVIIENLGESRDRLLF